MLGPLEFLHLQLALVLDKTNTQKDCCHAVVLLHFLFVCAVAFWKSYAIFHNVPTNLGELGYEGYS